MATKVFKALKPLAIPLIIFGVYEAPFRVYKKTLPNQFHKTNISIPLREVISEHGHTSLQVFDQLIEEAQYLHQFDTRDAIAKILLCEQILMDLKAKDDFDRYTKLLEAKILVSQSMRIAEALKNIQDASDFYESKGQLQDYLRAREKFYYLYSLKDLNGAVEKYKSILLFRKKNIGENDNMRARTILSLASILYASKQNEEAQKYENEALKIYKNEKLSDYERWEIGLALSRLNIIKENKEEAKGYLQSSMKISPNLRSKMDCFTQYETLSTNEEQKGVDAENKLTELNKEIGENKDVPYIIKAYYFAKLGGLYYDQKNFRSAATYLGLSLREFIDNHHYTPSFPILASYVLAKANSYVRFTSVNE